MRKRLVNILLALGIACALSATPAFADETNSASASSASSSSAASATTETTAVGPSIFERIHKTADPIMSLDRDTLFQYQYNWEAVETVNFDSANEDGSLSEWQVDWYISHDWSEYGGIIATLEPGDAVTVNGTTILILGREIWPKESINWDIYDAIGWDKTVFQTCLGDDAIWITYGIPVYPTQEFWDSHPPVNF